MVYQHIINFWPLVPAVDIQAVYKALQFRDEKILHDFDVPFREFQTNQANEPTSQACPIENINILIIGDGLGCLIKTISRMYRYNTLNINIYVVSNFSECFVRDLLLLSLFTDSSMGVIDKVEIFLEIFGNTLLRATTSEFIEKKSANILDDIVAFRQPMLSVPVAWLSYLKQKEIDDICSVLSYLKSKNSFDIGKAWENSLRAYFGTRYDSRKNLFDYHYNMKLSQYPIINLRKYLGWCETGIAFKLRKSKYNFSNKTFFLKSFPKTSKSNFIGDITTSPYIAFGVESKNETMFQKVNNQYVHTSEDVSKCNVTDFMTEFMSSKASDIEKKLNVYFFHYSSFCKTKKFENFYDVVYITCDMTSYAENESVNKILNENGIVVFETVNNVVNSTKEQKKKHLVDIDRFAEGNNLKSYDCLKSISDNFKIYNKKDNA